MKGKAEDRMDDQILREKNKIGTRGAQFVIGRDTNKANEGEQCSTQRRAAVTEGGYWGLEGSSGTDTKTTLQQQYLRAPLQRHLHTQ